MVVVVIQYTKYFRVYPEQLKISEYIVAQVQGKIMSTT